MNLYPILYLEINLMAVFLVLFIRFKTLGMTKMVSQRNFSKAIDAQIMFFLSDTAAVLLWSYAEEFSDKLVEQGESAVEEIAEIMSCELTRTDRRKVMEKLDYMCQPEDLERYQAEFAREDRQLPLSIHL